MNKTRIVSCAIFFIAIYLGYDLACKIYEPIQRQEEISKIEADVINQLKIIRIAQKEYLTYHGNYAATWQDLISFVDTGTSYNIRIKEVQKKQSVEWQFHPSISIITRDTISSQPVKEKLFPITKYPNFKTEKLAHVPGKDLHFDLNTSSVEMGGISIPVINVMDPDPEDKRRKHNHTFVNRRNLCFGSLKNASLEGNWSLH